MAFQTIDRKDITRALRSRAVKEEMDGVLDVAGDVIWFHDPIAATGRWDGKSTFGVKPSTTMIVLKTSKAGVKKLISRYKTSYISARKSGGAVDMKDDDKPYITLFIGTQKVKFAATGKLTDSSGKSISEATMTRMQELGSALVFRRAIQDNKEWSSAEKLKQDDVTMNGIKDIWKRVGKVDEVDDEWITNFYKQQKALLAKIGKPNFTEFNRDKGFMDFISKVVKDCCGIGTKDNWNPADIWLIQDETKWRGKIKEAMAEQTTMKSIHKLNAIMRKLFKERQVFGISLKKIAAGDDNAKIEFVNDKSEFFDKLNKLRFSYIAADCKMGKKTDKEGTITLSTQDTRLYVKDGSNVYNFQIKGNNSTDFSSLKYEPTASGATAARLGKATVELVLKLLKSYELPFAKESSSYPVNAKEFENNKGGNWLDLIRNLQKNRVSLDTKTAEEAYDNLAFVFGTKPHVANSKCQQIKWLNLFLSLSAEERDKFGTDMVFLAKKEGEDYGPFAKIY